MPLLPIAAAAAATFNLVCSGNISTTDLNGKRSDPFAYTLRLDLDQKLYCEDACKATRPIADVQAGVIALQDKKVDTLSEKSMIETTINRETGAYTTYSSSEDRRLGPASILIMKWEGTCTKAPFTGFAVPATKF